MMNPFPSGTYLHRRIPKEAFYKHLSLTGKQKENFTHQIEALYIENSLTADKLHLEKKGDVVEIDVLRIELREKELDSSLLETIARQNPHQLLFLLCFENQEKMGLYYKKLYLAEWADAGQTGMELKGFSLEEIWNSFIQQIALGEQNEKTAPEESLDEKLQRKERISQLEKLVAEKERAVWKEKQPKKKFGMYQELKKLKEQLEGLKNG